jgi:hypothetical protein
MGLPPPPCLSRPCSKTFSTVDPSSGDVLSHIAHGGAEDVNKAVAAARAAFDTGPWRRMTPSERKCVPHVQRLCVRAEWCALCTALRSCRVQGGGDGPPARPAVRYPVLPFPHVSGHTTQSAPALIRTPKLSCVGLG